MSLSAFKTKMKTIIVFMSITKTIIHISCVFFRETKTTEGKVIESWDQITNQFSNISEEKSRNRQHYCDILASLIKPRGFTKYMA